jgi:hypothetical protein
MSFTLTYKSSSTFDKIFETTYNEYATHINLNDLTASAYNVLNHFFTKFYYLFDKFETIKNNLERGKHDLDSSIGLCYDLDYLVRHIFIERLDPINYRNDYLQDIQMNILKRHTFIVEYIIKYEIYHIFRFRNLTDEEVNQRKQSMFLLCKQRCNEIQQYIDANTEYYINRRQIELQRIREIKEKVNILYESNLMCKDLTSIVCQYLI